MDVGKAWAPEVVGAWEWVPMPSTWPEMAKVPVMVEPDVVKAAAVVSSPRWVPGTVVARVAGMAALGMDVAKGANKAVAPKTWHPLRSMWSRRLPNREADHRARRPLRD